MCHCLHLSWHITLNLSLKWNKVDWNAVKTRRVYQFDFPGLCFNLPSPLSSMRAWWCLFPIAFTQLYKTSSCITHTNNIYKMYMNMHKTEAHAGQIIHEMNYAIQRTPSCSHLDDLWTLHVGTHHRVLSGWIFTIWSSDDAFSPVVSSPLVEFVADSYWMFYSFQSLHHCSHFMPLSILGESLTVNLPKVNWRVCESPPLFQVYLNNLKLLFSVFFPFPRPPCALWIMT